MNIKIWINILKQFFDYNMKYILTKKHKYMLNIYARKLIFGFAQRKHLLH